MKRTILLLGALFFLFTGCLNEAQPGGTTVDLNNEKDLDALEDGDSTVVGVEELGEAGLSDEEIEAIVEADPELEDEVAEAADNSGEEAADDSEYNDAEDSGDDDAIVEAEEEADDDTEDLAVVDSEDDADDDADENEDYDDWAEELGEDGEFLTTEEAFGTSVEYYAVPVGDGAYGVLTSNSVDINAFDIVVDLNNPMKGIYKIEADLNISGNLKKGVFVILIENDYGKKLGFMLVHVKKSGDVTVKGLLKIDNEDERLVFKFRKPAKLGDITVEVTALRFEALFKGFGKGKK